MHKTMQKVGSLVPVVINDRLFLVMRMVSLGIILLQSLEVTSAMRSMIASGRMLSRSSTRLRSVPHSLLIRSLIGCPRYSKTTDTKS